MYFVDHRNLISSLLVSAEMAKRRREEKRMEREIGVWLREEEVRIYYIKVGFTSFFYLFSNEEICKEVWREGVNE